MFRIPTTRLYRAFPELDRFDDDQCRRLMKRIELQPGANWLIRLVPLLLASLLFMAGCAGLFHYTTALRSAATWLYEDWDLVIALLLAFGTPAAVAFVSRDLLLRHYLIKAINMRIDRVRCRSCGYILIGQTAVDRRVCCPECGSVTRLSDLGITEADLLPPKAGIDQLSGES